MFVMSIIFTMILFGVSPYLLTIETKNKNSKGPIIAVVVVLGIIYTFMILLGKG